MTTKDQERKALAQIRKIVDALGNDSYIGKAFEGCFEMAEDNINNDFFNSMKDQRDGFCKSGYEALEKLRESHEEKKELSKKNERLEATLNEWKSCSDTLKENWKKAHEDAVKNWNMYREQEDKAEALQMEIIKLKARLFDMMEAQGA